MPVKKLKAQKAKVKTTTKKSKLESTDSSLRATAKQSQEKIATSSLDKLGTPRNDRVRTSGFSVPVYSLAGRASGTLSLPKEIFGVKVNKSLLTQAIRVYSTNQKKLLGQTKTRGEVEGSTVKIYRQKGTGRARHGAIRAPIFVGGGIVFGPQSRNIKLDLPKRMKKAALLSALSAKMVDKRILGMSGLDKASGKTKEIAKLLYQVSSMKYEGKDKKNSKIVSALIVTPEKIDKLVRGVRNIPGVSVLPVNLINAYDVLRHDLLLISKDAVEVLQPKEVR